MIQTSLLWYSSTRLRNSSFNENWVSVKDINIALVVIEVEDVVGFNSGRALLFVSKNQINPLVEMSTDVITLQSLETKQITCEPRCIFTADKRALNSRQSFYHSQTRVQLPPEPASPTNACCIPAKTDTAE